MRAGGPLPFASGVRRFRSAWVSSRKAKPAGSALARPRSRAGEVVARGSTPIPRVQRAPIDAAQIYYHPDFLDAATCAR